VCRRRRRSVRQKHDRDHRDAVGIGRRVKLSRQVGRGFGETGFGGGWWQAPGTNLY